MAFDRNQIIAYAKKYWNRVCDDNKVGLPGEVKDLTQKRRALIAEANAKKPGDWDIFFVPAGRGENAVFGRFDGSSIVDQNVDPILTDEKDHLNDCTHYVSKCLLAGGATIKETARAHELITALIASPATRVFVKETSQANGQKIVDAGLMRPGDVVGYAKANGNYHHSAVYTGEENSMIASSGDIGGITCHSNCRYGGLTKKINPKSAGDDAWYINDQAGTYTLIHFTSGDKPLNTGPLQGWWERNDGSFTYIDQKGTAYSTHAKPRKTSDRPPSNATKATPHASDRGVVFVWVMPHHRIDIEVWREGMHDSAAVAVWKNKAPEMATRMFQ